MLLDKHCVPCPYTFLTFTAVNVCLRISALDDDVTFLFRLLTIHYVPDKRKLKFKTTHKVWGLLVGSTWYDTGASGQMLVLLPQPQHMEGWREVFTASWSMCGSALWIQADQTPLNRSGYLMNKSKLSVWGVVLCVRFMHLFKSCYLFVKLYTPVQLMYESFITVLLIVQISTFDISKTLFYVLFKSVLFRSDLILVSLGFRTLSVVLHSEQNTTIRQDTVSKTLYSSRNTIQRAESLCTVFLI